MFALILALAPLATPAPGTRLCVILPPQIEIAQYEYHLRDIAELRGGEPVYRAAAAAIRIGYAPMPGHERRISAQWVHNRLVAAGIPRDAFLLGGAAITLVTPTTTTFSAEHIETIAREFLAARLSAAGVADHKLELRAAVEPLAVAAVAGSARLEASFSGLPRVRGPVSVEVAANCDGHRVGAALVRFQIRTFEERLVVNRPVYRGQPLDENNTVRTRVETTSARLDQAPAAGGKRIATRNLTPGKVLGNRDQRAEILVARGQPVTVVARIGRVRVTTVGRALNDGALGGRVGVECLDEKGRKTHRRLSGVVSATGTVEVGVK